MAVDQVVSPPFHRTQCLLKLSDLAVALSRLHQPPGQLGHREGCGQGELQVASASLVVTPAEILQDGRILSMTSVALSRVMTGGNVRCYDRWQGWVSCQIDDISGDV